MWKTHINGVKWENVQRLWARKPKSHDSTTAELSNQSHQPVPTGIKEILGPSTPPPLYTLLIFL